MQLRVIGTWVAIAAIVAAKGVSAEEELPIPADDFVYCTVCHGVQLMGNPILNSPRLSGMETWYVAQQLKNFKNGMSGEHPEDPFGYEMQPMAAALSDEQIEDVAQFTNATQSPAPVATVTGDVGKGKAHYSTCAACHGADGKGNEALGSPDLTTPNDWYTVTQLRNFKSGSRGSSPGDMYGAQMRASANLLVDDEAIMDVVSYINTLHDKK
jgi:cytochrome c oxidase subunit 2